QNDSQKEMAGGITQLLYERLGIAAVSVANNDEVLAHRGIGADHHCPGDPIHTSISKQVLQTNEMRIAYNKEDIECGHHKCPLEAAIMIPILEENTAKYIIKFYFKKPQHIRPVELTLAEGLGQLISNQL